ncbi:MAG: YgiQ family radical SAM protein [Candidatus Woesearchaeota archaeon]
MCFMGYDIIFIVGELYFDHPLCGMAILKRWLEKNGFSVGLIEMPKSEEDIKELGKPNLFFAISSGSIDSMVRNYTPLKKLRSEDQYLDYTNYVPDRAVIVFSNWVRKNFKGSPIVLGGTEASLRRFVHYDYWDNKLRKPILFDSRADILIYGSAEKQILEIAQKIKNKESLENIPGTCIISKSVPENFEIIPDFNEVTNSKEKFCQMQNQFSTIKNLAQKIDNRYILQYKNPIYTPKDLDEYYELPFSRKSPKSLRGFEFSVVTHRGCIGECNFCSITLLQGNKLVSRSEESIIREIKEMTKLPFFKGNIDDLGGPSANMYGMDCHLCEKSCLDCKKLDRSNNRLINLLKKIRGIPGIKNVYIRSGIRYDLVSPEYLKEVAEHHIYDTLKIAPEHINKNVLNLMNKDYGNLKQFLKDFKELNCRKDLSFYFMTAHPGSSMDEAYELANFIKQLHHAETTQVFTPTPMTISTCMYYTSLDPKTKKKIYVPYTYFEKKQQKRVIFQNRSDYENDISG